MKAMVLAAGFGTRFRPVTHELPKPLVPLCNRPLIAWAVDRLVQAEVTEIIVNLHHLPDELENFLRTEYQGRCEFEFSREEEILGTGGALRKVRSSLEQEEAFFLVNGDTIQFPPFQKMRAALDEQQSIACMLLRHPPANDKFTKVFLDDGKVTGFGEGSGEALMFAGAHAISHRLLDILPDRDFSGITEDVYVPLLKSGEETIAGLVDDGLWFDIGSPARYMSAFHDIRELILNGRVQAPGGSAAEMRTRSVVASDTTITGTLSECSVGSASTISTGASVSRSAVWEGCSITAGSRIENSIIANNVVISKALRVSNALVSNRRDGVEYSPETVELDGLVFVPIHPAKELIAQRL